MVNAAKAIQDVTHPTVVELREIDGDLGRADDSRSHLNAKVGFYDTVHQSLDLSQDVRILIPSYDVTLASANIDFKAGVYRSDEPVTVVMTNGTTITADSARRATTAQELTFSAMCDRRSCRRGVAEPEPAEMKGTNP